MPNAGSALFRGYSAGMLFTPTRGAVLGGEATLTVNFETGLLDGSIDVWASDENVVAASNDVALSATLHSGSNTFSGTAEAGPPGASEFSLDGSATGTFEGNFYGPTALELGAVWTLSDGTNAAIGSLGASSAGPETVGSAAPPSRGGNPSPAQTAASGGPTFGSDGPYPSNVTFPLTSTSLDFTASGVSAASNAQSATAIVKSSSATNTVIELMIPALNLDTTISILRSATSDGYMTYEGSGDRHSYGRLGALDYVSFGVWQQSSVFARPGSTTAFAFGYETPVSVMPSTGTAEYKSSDLVAGRVYLPQDGVVGGADLIGGAELTADFATGKIGGILEVFVDYVWDVPDTWHDVSIDANIAGGTNRFDGTTAVTGTSTSPYGLKDTATGVINGAFYGPTGENLGAVWTLSDGVGSAIGVVGARRQ
jgi:C-lobe and N-lobe beta barrels of Tf-binding protein B